MPQRFVGDPFMLLLFALAVVGGAWGGSAAIAYLAMRDRRVRLAVVSAYLIMGATIGVFVYLAGSWLDQPERLFGWSILAGAAGTLAMATKDFGVRFVLKRAGWEMRTEVYPVTTTPARDEHENMDSGEKRS